MNWIKATGLPICYRNRHLHRPDIDTTGMDDIRQSFSKMKKGFKHHLGGKKRGADRTGAGVSGETTSSSPLLTRPDSPATAGGRSEEGGRISTDVSQVHSRDRSPQPKPVPTDEGGNNLQGREAGVDGKGVTWSRSRLGPDVGGAAGSRPSREIRLAHSPLSITPISPKQEPDGTWAFSPQQLCLITLLDNATVAAVPDRVQEDLGPDENAEPSAAANEKKSSWKSTALATAKLLLRGVRDSSDAFGPLKSVAGGLCFVLENCEV